MAFIAHSLMLLGGSAATVWISWKAAEHAHILLWFTPAICWIYSSYGLRPYLSPDAKVSLTYRIFYTVVCSVPAALFLWGACNTAIPYNLWLSLALGTIVTPALFGEMTEDHRLDFIRHFIESVILTIIFAWLFKFPAKWFGLHEIGWEFLLLTVATFLSVTRIGQWILVFHGRQYIRSILCLGILSGFYVVLIRGSLLNSQNWSDLYGYPSSVSDWLDLIVSPGRLIDLTKNTALAFQQSCSK